MLYASSRALADSLTAAERAEGRVIPVVANVRAVSALVAAAVVQAAIDEGVARNVPQLRPGQTLKDWVEEQMYVPAYSPLVY
jgi:malate dehydrogenase (oxaloacetate-decarboxylating)